MITEGNCNPLSLIATTNWPIHFVRNSRPTHQRSGSLKPKQLTALDEALRLHLEL
jgi:hypothetical protein